MAASTLWPKAALTHLGGQDHTKLIRSPAIAPLSSVAPLDESALALGRCPRHAEFNDGQRLQQRTCLRAPWANTAVAAKPASIKA